jgi:hypothetical protein
MEVSSVLALTIAREANTLPGEGEAPHLSEAIIACIPETYEHAEVTLRYQEYVTHSSFIFSNVTAHLFVGSVGSKGKALGGRRSVAVYSNGQTQRENMRAYRVWTRSVCNRNDSNSPTT